MPTEDTGQTSRAMAEELLRGDSRRRGEACLSDLQLDQLILGELDARQAQQAQMHLSQCPACDAAHDLLLSDRLRFNAEVKVASVAARILERTKRPPKPPNGRLQRWVQVLVWPAAASAVAALTLIYFVGPASVRQKGAGPVRAKGANISLSTYVLFAGQDQPGTLHMGQPLAAGDRLQFRVSTTLAGHLAILSLDSRQEISVFYPTGERTVPIGRGRDQSLETAVELDDSPGQETVVALLCEKPQTIAAVVKALRSAAGDHRLLGLSAAIEGCSEARTTITKTIAHAR